jgi:hypothetical protein
VSSCGCGGACCDEGLHGYFLQGLEGITADAAAAQVTTHGVTSSGRANILSAARAGQLVNSSGAPAYVPGSGDCAGAPTSKLQLAQTATGLALTGTQTGLLVAGGTALATAAAPFTLGISALVGLFGVFIAHHRQAVAKEQSVLCSAVPAANNYLQVIDQAVRSGVVDPQHGIDALNSLLSDFTSAVSSISHECNAGCVMTEMLHAIVLVRTGEYQDLAAQQASVPTPTPQPQAVVPVPTAPPAPSSPAVTPARPNVVSVPSPGTVAASGTGGSAAGSSYASFYSRATPAAAPSSALPSWLPIAAVALAAFLFVRS